jgi:hypothetical protein
MPHISELIKPALRILISSAKHDVPDPEDVRQLQDSEIEGSARLAPEELARLIIQKERGKRLRRR